MARERIMGLILKTCEGEEDLKCYQASKGMRDIQMR